MCKSEIVREKVSERLFEKNNKTLCFIWDKCTIFFWSFWSESQILNTNVYHIIISLASNEVSVWSKTIIDNFMAIYQ